MQLDHLNAYHIGVDLAGNNQDSSVQLPVPLLHLGQVHYTAKDYIRIINGYWYREKCIFKPRNAMQAIFIRMRLDQRVLIATQIAKLHPNMNPRKRTVTNYAERIYVLNYGKDNPFYCGNEAAVDEHHRRVFNYKLYQTITADADDMTLDTIKKYIRTKPQYTVSDANKARLIMLGIRV